uniref:Uncharacterized protein n=1 Tax=Anguilla anguilla TaxID=7936 RepID=A0A0E9QHF8_ANGAN
MQPMIFITVYGRGLIFHIYSVTAKNTVNYIVVLVRR